MSPTVRCKMLVSHSPPVFSHSPPTSFLSEYTSFRIPSDKVPRGAFRSQGPFMNKVSAKMSPRRPCLVIRPPDEFPIPNDDDPTSPTKLKKKVVFADDKGMSLTQVRVMSEPSNIPPLWSNRFLAEVTQGISAEPVASREPWEIIFPQPASDYVDFRKKLDKDKVSLENVIVKDSEHLVIGTVKVNNISFKKEVIIRRSADDWITHEDTYCNYVANSVSTANTSAYVLYDTFSFKFTLPPTAIKIEFCVCYKCNEDEYWDNNDSRNYTILKKLLPSPNKKSYSCSDLYHQKGHANDKALNGETKYVDIVQAKLDSWSEFASWTHLENSSPYW